ncbi:hypothetical protein QWJ34_16500 [Saccharibacillus sp. CPCC 101409]|nr:hypothetical protein [Saccharibacillus sp. CPCC 101409]MDO3411368.1 hypothetical protein [Saccharibacillus sp. CPCC 101409]
MYRQTDAARKELLRIEDLHAGQRVEVSYFYPLTPFFLAMEFTVLEE